jgi:hypothetical protein
MSLVMEIKYLEPSVLEFFESNSGLFVRCDCDGKENSEGKFCRAREPMSRAQVAEREKF